MGCSRTAVKTRRYGIVHFLSSTLAFVDGLYNAARRDQLETFDCGFPLRSIKSYAREPTEILYPLRM